MKYKYTDNDILEISAYYDTDDLNNNEHEFQMNDEIIDKMQTCPNIMLIWMDNSKLDNIPENVEQLILYECTLFNQPLNNLPKKLVSLTIGSSYFNHPLYNLPNSLQCLNIKCDRFNQPLDYLPYGLINFSLRSRLFEYNFV